MYSKIRDFIATMWCLKFLLFSPETSMDYYGHLVLQAKLLDWTRITKSVNGYVPGTFLDAGNIAVKNLLGDNAERALYQPEFQVRNLLYLWQIQ